MAEAFKSLLIEWIALKEHIKAAKADLSVVNTREKELAAKIKSTMATNNYDTVNVSGTKVNFNQKISKTVSFSKANVTKGLENYFANDPVKVEAAITCITDLSQPKEVVSLSIKSGGKAKNEQ